MRTSKKPARILAVILASGLLALILSAAAFSAEDVYETEPIVEAVPYEIPIENEVTLSAGEETIPEQSLSEEEETIPEEEIVPEEESFASEEGSGAGVGESFFEEEQVSGEEDPMSVEVITYEEEGSETEETIPGEEDPEPEPEEGESPEEGDPGSEGEEVTDGEELEKTDPEETPIPPVEEEVSEYREEGVEEQKIQDRYDLGEDFDYSPFWQLNLSSKRIMVCSSESRILTDDPAVISEYDGIYLLQFEDETEALRAYAYYYYNAELVEADTGISVAEGEAADVVNTYEIMTEQSNPFSELEEALYNGGGSWFDIALIDTGANGAQESVSMLGGDAGDDHGHGTSMLGYIWEHNPDASVLSVKALDSSGTGSISEIFAAIEYAASRNVRIINLSISALASADSALIRMAVDEAVSRGIMVVGAAGNNGRNAAWYIPGSISSAYIIGSASETGERLPFSNYGETVDYHVRSASTSEAAARFSGWISRNGPEAIKTEVNRGFLFSASYSPEEEPSTEEVDPERSREIIICEDAGRIIARETVFCRNGVVRYPLRGESAVIEVYATMPAEEYESLLINDKTVPFEIDDETHTIIMYLTDDYIQRASSLIITETAVNADSLFLFSAADDSVTILDNPKIHFYWNGEDATDRYFVLDNGAIGFCGDYLASPPGIGSSAVPQTSSDPNLLKVLYYGADGPGAITAQEASWIIGAELSQDGFRAATSLAVSIAMTGYQGLPILSVIGDRLYQDLVSRETPVGVQAYVLSFGAPYQSLAYIGGFTGNVILQKTTEENMDLSKHPLTGAIYSIRNEDGSWEGHSFITGPDGTGYLTGAEYRVETEAEAVQLADPENVYTYVTGEGWYYAGGTSTIELTAGKNYFVREVKSPDDPVYLRWEESTGLFSLDRDETLMLDAGFHSIFRDQVEKSNLKIQKVSASPDLTTGGAYSLQGAVYGVFEDASCKVKAGELTTLENGWTEELEVIAGTYYVKELSASKGFFLDPEVYTVEVKADEVAVVISKEAPKTGSLQIEKTLDTGSLTESTKEIIRDSPEYSVDGAVYTIFTDAECTIPYGTEVLTITVSDAEGMEGISNIVNNVPLGIYYLKETKAGKNLQMDPRSYTVAITEQNCAAVQSPSEPSMDQPELGEVKLTKQSGIPEITQDNPCYFLGGAEYGIYTDKDCSDDSLYQTAVTDDQGSFTVSGIPYGTYYIKELRASEGFGLAACAVSGREDMLHTVTLSPSARVASIVCEEPVEGLPVRILVQKIDAQTKEPLPVAGGTFQDAEYTVWYYTNYSYSGDPERIWIISTDAEGKAAFQPDYLQTGSDDFYYDKAGQPVIPRGSFFVRETKAPEGYLPDPKEYCFQVNGGALSARDPVSALVPIATIPSFDPEKGFLSGEQIARGNFEFKKTEGGAERIANCLFEVTQTETGEVHYLVTDPNGVFRSEVFEKNNGNDSAVTRNDDGTYTVDESRLSYRNNVWFSMDREGHTAEPDAELASFPYGTYLFREIETSANQGLRMIIFRGSVYEVSGCANSGVLYDLGTKDDGTEGQPALHTTAWDEEDLDKTIKTEDESVQIIDKVFYSNCRRGTTYLIKGKLWDKTNGEFYRNEEGQELEIIQEFTAESADGYLEMAFPVSGELLREKRTGELVVFEWLYEEQILLDVHSDPNDQEQTILVIQEPVIGTELTDEEGKHEICAGPEIKLTDTVSYENLIPGRNYKIRGILMDKETGTPVTDEQGRKITAELVFTAETEQGSVELEFAFNGVILAGHTLVAFEALERNGQTLAVHADINDQDQTVEITPEPELPTEPATEPPTEPVTEPATEPPTEPLTEPESTTEPSTESPTEPETEPESPTTVQIPKRPENPPIEKKPGSTPQTGDTNRTLLYIIICCAALVIIVVTIILLIRRRNRL